MELPGRESAVVELLHAARVLACCGCLPATDGNFSARLVDRRILITARGIEKRALQADEFVDVDLDQDIPVGGSTEWHMHRMLYLHRMEVNCVLHVHAPALTTFSIAGRIPDVTLLAEACVGIGSIALVPYVAPGTERLGSALIDANPTALVYILANHGAVAAGRTVRETLHRLERAEFLARIQIGAASLGPVQGLTPDQVREIQRAQAI